MFTYDKIIIMHGLNNVNYYKLLRKCQRKRITMTVNKSALGRAHVPPTKVFPRLAVNKTVLKPRLAAATGAQYLYVNCSDGRPIPVRELFPR